VVHLEGQLVTIRGDSAAPGGGQARVIYQYVDPWVLAL
jgi:hypothetical protein